MLVFLLVLLIGGLGGFGYWAYSQGYLKSIPFLKMGSDNTTQKSGSVTYPAPKITGVQVSAKAIKEVGIVWTTDQPSSSQVEWGTSSSYGNITDMADDPTSGASMGVTTHGVTVKGLTANTEYHYRVISKNSGGETKSEDNTFTTPSE